MARNCERLEDAYDAAVAATQAVLADFRKLKLSQTERTPDDHEP